MGAIEIDKFQDSLSQKHNKMKYIKIRQALFATIFIANLAQADTQNQDSKIFDIEIGSKITSIPPCSKNTERFYSDKTCKISSTSSTGSTLVTYVAVNHRKMPIWGKYGIISVLAEKKTKLITTITVSGEVEDKREFEYIAQSISDRFGNYSIPLGKFQTKEWKNNKLHATLQTGINKEYTITIESIGSRERHQLELKRESNINANRPRAI